MPITTYLGIKDVLRNNDFVFFNKIIQNNPELENMMHLEDNYALKTVIKKGILSSTKVLLGIESVWLTFNEDEMMHLAEEFSHHNGIQRVIAKEAFARFEHVLMTSDGPAKDALQMIRNSHFLSAHSGHALKLVIKHGVYSLTNELLKNSDVAEHCGLNELFLALKCSNHAGIVRALLKNPAVGKLVGPEREVIENALTEGSFAQSIGSLQCLKGITEASALSIAPAKAEPVSDLVKNSLFTLAAPPPSPALSPVPEEDIRVELF